MTASTESKSQRITYLEADGTGVLAIAGKHMEYVCGDFARAALEEHLADGNFKELSTDTDHDCYLREGEEIPLHIRPHVVAAP